MILAVCFSSALDLLDDDKWMADQTFGRMVDTLPVRKHVDLSDMKERNASDWSESREQQVQEREPACVKSTRLKEQEKGNFDKEAAQEKMSFRDR